MATASPEIDSPKNFGELLERLGGICPSRIRMDPPPGKATEKDVERIHDRTDRLFELVDGVLVEKVMGYAEGSLAAWLGYLIQDFLQENDLGNLAGADGTVRLMPKLVRIPDLSFVRWEKLPGRKLPEKPIPDLIPDLAVEVLSKSNTPGEMKRKLHDYFSTGVQLVWFVDMKKQIVQVYTTPEDSITFSKKDTLDGGDVLPGLKIRVKDIFARMNRARNANGSGRKAVNRKNKGSKKKKK